MNALVVDNHGQIERISIPGGWQQSPDAPRSDMDIVTLKKFHAADSDDVQLCFYYRGMPMSESAADKFHKLMSGKPHQLTPAEIRSIEGALESLADDHLFDMLNARIEDLNGKNVLFIEGRWKAIGFDTVHILLDADGEGAQVQEIYYAAPKAVYAKYLSEARASFKSVVWKRK